MIYQINGKFFSRTEKPTGKFLKVVTVPGKLMNFITKESKPDTLDFWLNNIHVAINRKFQLYINGQLI